jgi:hypothetical protein
VVVRWRATGGAATAGFFLKKKILPRVDKKTLGEGEGNDTDAVNTSFPSVRYVALGEDLFHVSRFPGASSPSDENGRTKSRYRPPVFPYLSHFQR